MVKASAVDLEPIDRLAQKVEQLVKVLERSRAEHTRLVEENTRLARELEAMRGQLAAAEGDGAEIRMLKAERDQIRSRVSEMLEQLEGLSI